MIKIIPYDGQPYALFGAYDENIEELRRLSGAEIKLNGEGLILSGEESAVESAAKALEFLNTQLKSGQEIDIMTVRYSMTAHEENDGQGMGDAVAVTFKGRRIKAKTFGQKKYIAAIQKNTVVFAEGPAGTGKTYLAMAEAVVAIKKKRVERIILTRPAVEAGEKLGFLPGDLQDKVDPYLRPLYDALYDFLGAENAKKLIEKGAVEVAPLAYMRGRTLNDAFIVLDEAQNCTVEQMKMFLTRLGEGSKIVVTGDLTQTDLPPEKKSGLRHAISILKDIDDIEVVSLTFKDVVRHHLVQNIIMAYDSDGKRK